MKYSKIILLLTVLMTMSLITKAQVETDVKKSEKDSKAQEILALARKAIYKDIEPEQIKSFHFEIKSTVFTDSKVKVEGADKPTTTKVRFDIEEVMFVDLPSKIKYAAVTREADKNPMENFTTVTMILNGDNVFFDTKQIADGKLVDINAVLNSENIPEATKKSIREQQEKARAAITEEYIKGKVSERTLHHLLYNPWEEESFSYVGKAEAEGTKADVLELQLSPSNKVRFFFDEKTHLLLLTIQEVDEKYTKGKVSYYFADYKLKSGVLVAHKINLESENTVNRELGGKNISTDVKLVSEMTTEKFEINPVLKAEVFAQK